MNERLAGENSKPPLRILLLVDSIEKQPRVSDARGARPGGQLFRSGTDLIRPAQDGTPACGTAIAFKRIHRLDTEEYCEELVAQAAPNWSPLVTGTHTINAAGPLSVIDFRCRVRR